MPSHRTSNSSESLSKALFACLSCRAQKKGCDKALPACSTCTRLRRPCEYSSGHPPSVALPRSYQKLLERVALLENEISQHRPPQDIEAVLMQTKITSIIRSTADKSSYSHGQAFPSSFFLDVDVFQQQAVAAHRPRAQIPDQVLRALGDEVQIQATVDAYFASVSTWMAMISRERIYESTSAQPFAIEIDVALLSLAMKLVNDRLPAHGMFPRTELYIVTKEFFSYVESVGIGSLRLIQAAILITLYEMGHSIYPEAYLSLGHCGRLGQAIGLHDTGRIPQLALEPESWDEMEERRRVWWAVYILDRHLNIGNSTRSLALAEPGRGDYLPVDDTVWEQAEKVVSEPLFVSSATNISAAPFARLGQASHLLGHVMTHIKDHNLVPSTQLEEASQLSRAILALNSFLHAEISSEATKVCVPVGSCYSALILLYEHSAKAGVGANPTPEEQALQEMANAGLDALVPEVVGYAGHIQTIASLYTEQVSPLVMHCLYRTAKRLAGISNPDSCVALSFIKEVLYKLCSRWGAAEEYLNMLSQIEAEQSTMCNTDLVG